MPLVRRQYNSMDQETSTQDDGRGTLSRQVCAVSNLDLFPRFLSFFCVREHDLPSLKPPFFRGYVSLGFSYIYIYYLYSCKIYIYSIYQFLFKTCMHLFIYSPTATSFAFVPCKECPPGWSSNMSIKCYSARNARFRHVRYLEDHPSQ